MSAPAPNTDTGGLINSRLNPISKRNSVQPLIKNFSNFLEDLPLDQLKLLESANDISEFQGILGALIHDDNEGGENVFDMIDQLKDRYTMLHGIVRGLIAKTGKSNPVSGNEPSIQKERLHPVSRTKEPSKEPSRKSNGQSSQKEVKSQLDGAVEKMVEQQLMATMKPLPVEDLEKLQGMLAEGNDPSLILKRLQPAFPKLTDELIKVAVKYPSELTAVIEQIVFDYKLEGVTPAATTAQPFQEKNWKETEKDAAEKLAAEEADKLAPEKLAAEEAYIFTPSDARNGDDDVVSYKADDYQYTKDMSRPKPWNPYWERQTTNWMRSWQKPSTNWVPYWARYTTNWMQDFQQRPVKNGGWFGAWHFLIIFLLIAALVGVGYTCSHNKTKIQAYIAEVASKGRKARNYTYKQVSTT